MLPHLYILTTICRSGVTPLGSARAALHYQPVEIGALPRENCLAIETYSVTHVQLASVVRS